VSVPSLIGELQENNVTTQVVILAAGMGSRLGRTLPKPLTELSDGRTIMGQQFDNIRFAFGSAAQVTVVVGYKLEHIIEAFPQASFVYNEQYDQTNTSKSLLRALQASGPGGVLWMNGDVVFAPEVLERAAIMIAREQSFVTVNTASVADEEVKYTTSAEGYINELSKTVKNGLGEAVGINYVSRADKATLIRHLARVGAQDYFERGIETAISQDRMLVEPVDISDLYAVEVDFAEDLERANLANSHK
jgi:choline kinase